MKLDRLISKVDALGRRQAREAIANGRVWVDGKLVTRHDIGVTRFERVELGGAVVQPGERRLWVMLYKPSGVLSATRDDEHRTVMDLIDHPDKGTLHLAGRLDRSTTGLVVLTNDGVWSKRLTAAAQKIPKSYLVETRDPIAPEAVEKFREGFYFHTEDITTLPAQLEILDSCKARLVLHEGRYHQVKRMFHRVDNRVVSLHRESIGAMVLPTDWKPGDWKLLSESEAKLITTADGSGLQG